MCPEQHGFRRGRSCETQLLGYVDEATEEMERGFQQDTIVMDFSKAFDKVSHSLLVHKLRRYGITGNVNRWIDAFLCDRLQTVVVDGVSSQPAPVESGVPQGSVLGPTLFNLYINDLPLNINSRVRLFADDTFCHRPTKTSQDQEVLQNDINKLVEWEAKWKMAFHPEKCQVLRATRRRQKLPFPYSIHGHTLEDVKEAKYLGVTITDDLTWSSHITNITKKANKTLGFLRRNLVIGSKKTREQAYKAFVRPVLEYCSPVWDPHAEKDKTALDKVQNRAARWVARRFDHTTDVNDITASLSWTPLKTRRRIKRLSTFYKFHKNLIQIKSEYAPKPTQSRRTERNFHPYQYETFAHRTQYRLSSYFPQTVRDWNALPAEVVAAPDLDSFEARLAALH